MSDEGFPDYYELLKIAPKATAVEIRRAYLEEVGFYHPDNFHGRAEKAVRRALDMTVRLNQAKEILLSPEKRQQYDELLAEWKALRHPAHAQHTTPNEEHLEQTDETCELCGKPLVRMVIKYTELFLVCSDYPECRNTRSILVETGVSCPHCGGDILEKRSKEGRRFFGCSKYPQCDFAIPQRPVAQVCSACGGLMVLSGLRQARCTGCGRREILREKTGL